MAWLHVAELWRSCKSEFLSNHGRCFSNDGRGQTAVDESAASWPCVGRDWLSHALRGRTTILVSSPFSAATSRGFTDRN